MCVVANSGSVRCGWMCSRLFAMPRSAESGRGRWRGAACATPSAPSDRSGRTRRHGAGATALRSSATGTRPCRSRGRRWSGTRSCTPCRRGTGRARPSPPRSASRLRALRPAASPTADARGRASSASLRASPCSSGTSCRRRPCGTRPRRRSAASRWPAIRCRSESGNASRPASAGSRRRGADPRAARARRSACRDSSCCRDPRGA